MFYTFFPYQVFKIWYFQLTAQLTLYWLHHISNTQQPQVVTGYLVQVCSISQKWMLQNVAKCVLYCPVVIFFYFPFPPFSVLCHFTFSFPSLKLILFFPISDQLCFQFTVIFSSEFQRHEGHLNMTQTHRFCFYFNGDSYSILWVKK